MWSIKQHDLASKEWLSKMKLLDSLVAKQTLADYEEALKKKLIDDFKFLVLGLLSYCDGVLVSVLLTYRYCSGHELLFNEHWEHWEH
ncbi:hypothetical protein F2Q69_00025044 [Brassica cretica]|uniref:Uncharacterized protein n=1 Tax=Brassica cretica TaxID=69181 RepID=A0A8S9Q7H6_BRACR|nr:hypothetical protein F2Q69_00025044 [Brassica cretica]